MLIVPIKSLPVQNRQWEPLLAQPDSFSKQGAQSRRIGGQAQTSQLASLMVRRGPTKWARDIPGDQISDTDCAHTRQHPEECI